MNLNGTGLQLLRNETKGLLSRLDRLEPFALRVPMVPAAAVPLAAQVAIDRHLTRAGRLLRNMMRANLRWLNSAEGAHSPLSLAQRRFSFLRLRFVAVLAQLDIFADVLNQRSEHETGIWLSGLDVFAADALQLPGNYYQSPPVVCFLERTAGAAIRRAKTRLPGGDDNPVAVIQVPRERMIGSGIAASIVHEVGHQGAALLDLVTPLRILLHKSETSCLSQEKTAWSCWKRWISEIVADLWAVARLGIPATAGLMTVVSLPRAFMFRVDLADPHPAPWIRVKLSCAMGNALYPHPQWSILDRTWEELYPREGLPPPTMHLFSMLERTMQRFVRQLIGFRPPSLGGKCLGAALASADREPERLRMLYRRWKTDPSLMRRLPPTLVFAVIGQAKLDETIRPEREGQLLELLLRQWALKMNLDTSMICSAGRSS